MQPPSSHQCNFVCRETDAVGTLCQRRSGPGDARLGVIILHPSWVEGYCPSFLGLGAVCLLDAAGSTHVCREGGSTAIV